MIDASNATEIIVSAIVVCGALVVMLPFAEIPEPLDAAEVAFENFVKKEEVSCDDHNYWGAGSSCPHCDKDIDGVFS